MKRKRLVGRGKEIQHLLAKKISVSGISRLPGVHRLTVAARIKQHPGG